MKMTMMKKVLLAGAAALTMGLTASTASATCWFGCPSTSGSWQGNYDAGGQATNEGAAHGNWTMAQSATTKDVYGGTDLSNNSSPSVYAGSHFATTGKSAAMSMGWGHSSAGSSEMGSVTGGAVISWGRAPAAAPSPN